jgi:hypothetical protein
VDTFSTQEARRFAQSKGKREVAVVGVFTNNRSRVFVIMILKTE